MPWPAGLAYRTYLHHLHGENFARRGLPSPHLQRRARQECRLDPLLGPAQTVPHVEVRVLHSLAVDLLFPWHQIKRDTYVHRYVDATRTGMDLFC